MGVFDVRSVLLGMPFAAWSGFWKLGFGFGFEVDLGCVRIAINCFRG